jgi:SAM-dependent methyltransferase
MKYKALLPAGLRARLDMGRHAVDAFVREVAGDLPPDVTVLDAGAGEGTYGRYFTAQRYLPVDSGVGEARWDYQRLAVRGDLLALPFADGSVEVILSTQTLEHLPDPGGFLREAARVLAPDGKLFLTAPQGFKEHQQPHDYFRYTSYGLRRLCQDAGLVVDFVRPQGGYFKLLGDRVQPFHRYAFGGLRQRLSLWPLLLLHPPVKLLCTVLLPLLCLCLDPRDTKRQHTVGYELGATRPQEAP